MSEPTTLHIRVPASVMAQLDAVCEETGQTRTGLVMSYLDRCLRDRRAHLVELTGRVELPAGDSDA